MGGLVKGGGMELPELRALLRRSWWLLVLTTVIGIGLAIGRVVLSDPTYSSTVQFFVSATPEGTKTALQSDIYTQRRMNTYLKLLDSDELAERLRERSGVELGADEIRSDLTGTIDTATVLLNVRVTTHDPDTAAALADAVVIELEAMVAELERTAEGENPNVALTVVNGPAADPQHPRDNYLLNGLLGALVGLAVGLAVATARQRLDVRIRSIHAAEVEGGLPMLGSVPAEPRWRPGGAGRDRGDEVRRDAFRALRTSLLWSGHVDRRVLLITSPTAAAEDSSIASGLARAFAETHLRVVLVDANLRAGHLTIMESLTGRPGLSDVLLGRTELAQVLDPTKSGAVSILPAGSPPPNPAELLASNRMRAVISRLREDADLVIVDAPPTNPVTDARICATWSDQVMLALRYGRTTRSDIRVAVRALGAIGVTAIVGVGIGGRASGSAWAGETTRETGATARR